jgi:hypothetical protein
MVLQGLTSELIKNEIIILSEGRFTNESNEFLGSILDEITPKELEDTAIVTLKRALSKYAGKRTLLVAVVDSQEKIKVALQWAATVKDELTEPENGDVYIFLAIKDETMSVDQCTGIESSERICRRYVLRPDENIKDYLCRSFLAPVMSMEIADKISDPLNLALEQTSEKQTWFNTKQQKIWRQALLSGKSSSEIVKALFKS